MQLFVHGGPGGPDCLDIGLLDMPFVQSRQAHGDSFPPKAHAAFYFGFSAHMEGPGTGNPFEKVCNHRGLHPGTDDFLSGKWKRQP